MAQLDHTFTKNQGMQLSSWLAREHGFEPGKLGAQGMVKVLDDQHALGVSIGSSTLAVENAVDEASQWVVSFSFSRRDLNEQAHQFRPDKYDETWFHFSTIFGRGLVTEEQIILDKDVPFEAGFEVIEPAVEKALTLPNLGFIEKNLYDPPGGAKRHLLLAVINDALNGVDRVWDEYLADHERIMGLEKKEDLKQTRTAFDQQLRAFKAKFPDGIPRE